MTLKIIMRSTWLHDAITELASTAPTTLVLTASNHAPPLFALKGTGGPFGDSVVDFQPEPSRSCNPGALSDGTDSGSEKQSPLVSETFTVFPAPGTRGRVRQRYKFAHLQKAASAMDLASKVCIRCDGQGVLSLQFMIEVSSDGVGVRRNADGPNGGAGTAVDPKLSFVDFRFVPLIDEDDEEDWTDEDDDSLDMDMHRDGSTETTR